MEFEPFHLERWQSLHEHQVRYNLSESGVHPLTVQELLELTGEPDMKKALMGERLGYPQTNGTSGLRTRIAAMYEGVDPHGVLATVGGAEANFVALWQLLDPETPVATVFPTYMQIPGLVRSLGGRVLPVPLEEEAGWAPDLDALRDALSRGARVVVVTNPNNPTGAVLSTAAMDEIVEAARSVDAWILADEVYRGAELAGPETPSFMGRYPRVLVTGSLSKAYGLPGLRLGWVAGAPDAVDELWGRKDYTTIAPTRLSDLLARAALEPGTREKLLERTRGILRENLPVLERWVRELDGRVSFQPPRAGAIAYLRYRSAINSSALAQEIRRVKDVLVVPGDQFGMDGYLRVGYGEPGPRLEEALSRVGETLRALD